MTLCHKWCNLPSVSNGTRGCVEKDCCSSHCLQGRNLSPRGGDGAITWHISTNPHEIHVHTGKLTCPLWKTYISIGNSSSNQWFSGDMLVSGEFSNYFLTTHPPPKKNDDGYCLWDMLTCWHRERWKRSVFSSGPYANRRCIAFASWEDCRESRNPESEGRQVVQRNPHGFQGAAHAPNHWDRWILISVAGGFFSLGQSFIVNIVN